MAYNVLVAAHVVAAVIGFGAIALTGGYAASAGRVARAGRTGRAGVGAHPRTEVTEETIRYFRGRGVGEWAMVAVPFLGVAAVVVQPHGRGLAHTWVAIAVVLWSVALVAAGAVGRPARAALRRALPSSPDPADTDPADPDPADPDPADTDSGDLGALTAAAARLARAAAVCDAVFVLAAIDMVLRP